MRRALTFAVAVALLLFGPGASAHRIDEYLQATLLSIEADRACMSMRLIPGTMVAADVIAAIDADRDGAFSEREQRAYAQAVLRDLVLSVDGQSAPPTLLSWTFPSPAQMRVGLGEIAIAYSVPLAGGGKHTVTLDNRHMRQRSVYLMNALVPLDPATQILDQQRDARQSRYSIVYQRIDRTARAPGPWDGIRDRLDGVQFSALFQLGMRHIAEGTDHLLFLLVLLLPAPLLAAGRRWGRPVGARQGLLRILGIVTAFTIGHSLTLMLAALGVVALPSRPVEAMIALSILVSALHALRPLFPGREAWVAAGFGLVHGLAFASTLDRLGLGLWEKGAGILAFNLGVEAMQLLVIGAALPSLLMMASTRAYPALRIGGALFAGLASLGWLVERVSGVTAHVDAVVDGLARHGVLLAGGLFVASLLCRGVPTFRCWRMKATTAQLDDGNIHLIDMQR